MRRLRPIVLDLDLLPDVYRVRSGLDDMPRAPAREDVEWHTVAHSSQHDGHGFRSDVEGERYSARATLPYAPGISFGARRVLTDDEFDVVANGPRVADAPPLLAASLRAWLAIELHHLAPSGSTVTYRLHDGTADRYWDGGAWAVAVDPALHWSTRAEVQANFADFPPEGRTLVVRARLSSTDVSARPSFLGLRVMYGLRDLGDEEDALIRSLQRVLTNEVRPTAIARFTVAVGTGAEPLVLGPEVGYDITAVLAVFDLTDDPDELVELPGVFAAGDYPDTAGATPATWTPAAPIADGHELHVEFAYRPDVVVSRHRDVVELPRVPAVLFLPSGAPSVIRTGVDHVVRDLEVDPPTGVALAGSAWHEQPLAVSVIAEKGSDVRRIQDDLRQALGGCGYRSILSPETGRIVDVRQITGFRTGGGRLLQGVQESTADWVLGYAVESAAELMAVHLTRAGGVIASVPTGA